MVCAGTQGRGLHFSLGKGQVREDFLEEGAMVPSKPMILDISWGLTAPGEGPSTTQCKFYLHPACTPVHTRAHAHTHAHTLLGPFCSKGEEERGEGGGWS